MADSFPASPTLIQRLPNVYRSLGPMWQTLIDTSLVLILKLAVAGHLSPKLVRDSASASEIGVSMVQDGRRTHGAYIEDLVVFGLLTVVLAPIFEEALYRGMPILLARRVAKGHSQKKSALIVTTIAVLSTLIFAWSHNPVLWALPLSQLISGAVAWRIAWIRGLRYSILFHVLINLYVFVLFAQIVARYSG